MAKISPKTIAEAIYAATEGKSGAELAEVLGRSAEVLRKKHLLNKSKEVLAALQNIIEKKTGVVRAKVTTAKSLTSGERKTIENEIKEKYKGQNVIGEFLEKPELLGGMRVEVGDEVLDTTYRNQLYRLEKFLIKEA